MRWSPFSADQQCDPRRTLDHLRKQCPLVQSPQGITLLKHADILAAASDPQLFSSATSEFRAIPNTLDPPEHAHYRQLIDSYFLPHQLQSLEPRIRKIATDLVRSLPHNTTLDAITHIGIPFAVSAQTEWLGWKGIEAELIAWMARNHAATHSQNRQQKADVAAEFDALVLTQVKKRQLRGDTSTTDPTTYLLSAQINGKPLSDTEIVSILRNWTAGDLSSMAAALGVICHFLATHPEIQQTLREGTDPASAIDEMLRIDDPFLHNRRITTSATLISGHEIPQRTRIYLNWTSANRDEAVFGDPDDYQPEKNAAHNLVYGSGIHLCPGRPLATLELVIAMQTLLNHTQHITLSKNKKSTRASYPLGGWSQLFIELN